MPPTPEECDVCFKRFKNNSSLSAHKSQSHRGVKFICQESECSRVFRRKADLLRHQNTHKRQSRINNSTTLSRNRIQPDSSAGFNPTYDDSTLHPPVSPSGVKRPGDAQTDPTPLIQLQHTDATSSGDTTETARGRSASGSHQHGEGIRVPAMDPVKELMEYGEALREIYRKYHPIINRHHQEKKIKAEYNFRITNNYISFNDMQSQMNYIYFNEKEAFKINVTFGFILRNIETHKLRYFYAHENDAVFDLPFIISSKPDTLELVNQLCSVDITEKVTANRPNTKWQIFKLCNIRYNVSRLNYTLGAGNTFPSYIVQNKSMKTLDYDPKTGEAYNDDNSCFFRCLAAHKKGANKRISLLAKALKLEWLKHKNISENEFQGVSLSEMSDLEDFFDINIFVYHMEKTGGLLSLHKPMKKRKNVMYLNEWEGHLCLIVRMQTLKHCFKCRSCGKLNKTSWTNSRHERNCDRSKKITFPGKFYKSPLSIFQKLERWGINVSEKDRFTPEFAVYDFEALLLNKPPSDDVSNTVYVSEHIPISTCISSNVPGFTDYTFCCNENPEQLVADFVNYLHRIQDHVYSMKKKKYKQVFDYLENRIQQVQEFIDSLKQESESDDSNDFSTCRESYEPVDHGSAEFRQKIQERSTWHEMLTHYNEIDEAPIDREQNIIFRNQVFSRSACEENTESSNECNISEVQIPNENTEIIFTTEGPAIQYLKQIRRLQEEFENYCSQLCVLGFNNSRYDLNLVKRYLIKELDLANDAKYISKKNSAYSCITTSRLRLLDVASYLAAGYSYDNFIKAYDIPLTKSFFPYEWFNSVEKLAYPRLPEYDAFFSTLKQCNVLEEEYLKFQKLFNKFGNENEVLQKMNLKHRPKTGLENYADLQEIWKQKGMSTFKDFLEYYNSLDVIPMVAATDKLLNFYFGLNIDLFKQCQSSPGAARLLMFSGIENNFCLLDYKNKDLHDLYRLNSIGGASIVFCRHQEVGVTKIRDTNNKTKIVVGWDVNALYLHCFGKPMPTGYMIRRLAENNFKPENNLQYKLMFEWMDFVSYVKGITIQHAVNSGGHEKYIPPYYLDGFTPSSNTNKAIAFEFSGCYWHGHSSYDCSITKNIKSPKWPEMQKERYERTIKKKEFLEANGFQYVHIWECEYKKMKKENTSLKDFLKSRDNLYMKGRYCMTEKEIIDAIQKEEMFGCVECDIEVPPSLYSKFSEFSPIFCTSEVSYESMGPVMMEYAKANNISKTPRILLIGGMKAHKIMLSTPLLKWYLDEGLIVTKIYQTIEFEKNQRCFQHLVDTVTAARREGDLNSDSKIKADSMKLLGNASFGSSLLNKERYKKTKYVDSIKKAQFLVNNPNYIDLSEVNTDLFEIELQKEKVVQDMPEQIGYFILCYAKLEMLKFYYQFLDVFFSRDHFVIISTDTDSLYVGFSSDNPFNLVPVNLRERLCDEWGQWFPREFCSQHENDFRKAIIEGKPWTAKCSKCKDRYKYESRQPGLLKVEFKGHKMIALCSKMYCAENKITEETKLSCKGINKRSVPQPIPIFEKALFDKQTQQAKNRGFIVKDNAIFTYEQNRASFTFFYPKRRVCEDLVNTEPLDIVLTPVKRRK